MSIKSAVFSRISWHQRSENRRTLCNDPVENDSARRYRRYLLEFLLECASKIIHEMERLAAIEFVDYRTLDEHILSSCPSVFSNPLRFSTGECTDWRNQAAIQWVVWTDETSTGFFRRPRRHDPWWRNRLFYDFVWWRTEQKAKRDYFQLNALVVCPSGISSSLILESELKELFPRSIFAGSFDRRVWKCSV